MLAEAAVEDHTEPAVPSGSVQSVMAQVSAPAKPVMAAPAKLVLHANFKKSNALTKAAVAVAAPAVSAETQASQELNKLDQVKTILSKGTQNVYLSLRQRALRNIELQK